MGRVSSTWNQADLEPDGPVLCKESQVPEARLLLVPGLGPWYADPVHKPSLLTLVALVSCGGPASTGPSARSAGEDPADTTASTDPSGPRLPNCEDGSCFACGDTVCLKGYYCETLGNVSGCAWNAPCANKASCNCLTSQPSHDSSCSCEERDGHAFVSCQ
jgi:hypothetical protein